jgi:hypothetical protein
MALRQAPTSTLRTAVEGSHEADHVAQGHLTRNPIRTRATSDDGPSVSQGKRSSSANSHSAASTARLLCTGRQAVSGSSRVRNG